MNWELAIVAATVLAVAAVSRRLSGTPVTPAMVFVLIGVLVGPLVVDEVTNAPTGSAVRTLAEATLAVVLFADASRIKPRVLRREYAVPLRLLGIGLPLTIALGAVLAALIFDPHGLSAAPRAQRYARWYESHARDPVPTMESAPTPDHRTREAPNPKAAAARRHRAAGIVPGHG
jgi:hypothetical protein